MNDYPPSDFDTKSIYDYLSNIFNTEWPIINDLFQNNGNMYIFGNLVNNACHIDGIVDNSFVITICNSKVNELSNVFLLISMFYNAGFEVNDDISFTRQDLLMNEFIEFEKTVVDKRIIFHLYYTPSDIIECIETMPTDILCNYMSGQGVIYCKSIYDITNNIKRFKLYKFALYLKLSSAISDMLNEEDINLIYIDNYKLSYKAIRYLLNSNNIRQYPRNMQLKKQYLTIYTIHNNNVNCIDCDLRRHILIVMIVDKFINKK